MEKITVETTGPFTLLDLQSGYQIPVDKAVSVPHTSFVGERIELGQLTDKITKPVEEIEQTIDVELMRTETTGEEAPADEPAGANAPEPAQALGAAALDAAKPAADPEKPVDNGGTSQRRRHK